MKTYLSVLFCLLVMATQGHSRNQVGITGIREKASTGKDDFAVQKIETFYAIENYTDQYFYVVVSKEPRKRFEFDITVSAENKFGEYGLGGMNLNPKTPKAFGAGTFFFGVDTGGRIVLQYNDTDEWKTLKAEPSPKGPNVAYRLQAVSDGSRIGFYVGGSLFYKTERLSTTSMYPLIYAKSGTLLWLDQKFAFWDLAGDRVELSTTYRPQGGNYDLDWLTRPDYIQGGKDPKSPSETKPDTVTLGTEWKVTEVTDSKIYVSRKRGDSPTVGDRVKIYFLIKDIGIEAQKATGSISQVHRAQFEVKLQQDSISGKIQKGDLVAELE